MLLVRRAIRSAATEAGRAKRSSHSIHCEPFTRNLIHMITVGMNYHVIPGKQADFENKFATVISALRAAEGHSSSTLWKDVSDDASYLITSEWSEEQAFLDFIHSQAFKDVTSWGKEQILSGRPQHKIYKN
jgi:heme-degrading monooxygenase HmoA